MGGLISLCLCRLGEVARLILVILVIEVIFHLLVGAVVGGVRLSTISVRLDLGLHCTLKVACSRVEALKDDVCEASLHKVHEVDVLSYRGLGRGLHYADVVDAA